MKRYAVLGKYKFLDLKRILIFDIAADACAAARNRAAAYRFYADGWTELDCGAGRNRATATCVWTLVHDWACGRMKIVECKITECTLPFRTSVRTSRGEIDARRVILIAVKFEDGQVG